MVKRRFLPFRECLILPEEAIYDTLGKESDEIVPGLLFQDHGSRVLVVTHLDTVLMGPIKEKSGVIACPTLDDRLGVWLALHVLAELGIKSDLLFTTGEEQCRSSARFFPETNYYDILVGLDRAGEDVVCYQYEDTMKECLEGGGFNVGIGTYSDICDLEHLGTGAFNVGIGYHLQHTPQCFVDLRETRRNMLRLQRFLAAYSGFRFEHEATKFPYGEGFSPPRL